MIVIMKAMVGALTCAALAAALVVVHAASNPAEAGRSPAEAPLGAKADAKAGDPAKGERIFTLQKCTTCHKVNGKGPTTLGPDLGTIGSRRDAASLAKFLVKPTPLDPAKPPIVKMEAVKVKGQDLDDLIAYLLTLKTRK